MPSANRTQVTVHGEHAAPFVSFNVVHPLCNSELSTVRNETSLQSLQR